MNHIMKWNPLSEMQNIHRGLATLMDGAEGSTVAEWAPAVDIIEDDKAYVIKAELPEMKKEDVSVQLENGVLTITGERKVEKEQRTRIYHRVERAYGAFARSFELPDNIDADKASASYKDGMLTVTVAKSENAKPKLIEVKA